MTDYLFKVLIIGDSSVGKSSLLIRYTDNQFFSQYISTLGCDFRLKTLDLTYNQQPCKAKIQLWDTAGQEAYSQIVKSFYRGSNGILLVFAVDNKESFQNIKKWLEKTKENAGENVVKMLIAAKADLENRQVTTSEAQEFATSMGMDYIETSAKDSVNVNESFERITLKMIEKFGKELDTQGGEEYIEPVEEQPKKCC